MDGFTVVVDFFAVVVAVADGTVSVGVVTADVGYRVVSGCDAVDNVFVDGDNFVEVEALVEGVVSVLGVIEVIAVVVVCVTVAVASAVGEGVVCARLLGFNTAD